MRRRWTDQLSEGNPGGAWWATQSDFLSLKILPRQRRWTEQLSEGNTGGNRSWWRPPPPSVATYWPAVYRECASKRDIDIFWKSPCLYHCLDLKEQKRTFVRSSQFIHSIGLPNMIATCNLQGTFWDGVWVKENMNLILQQWPWVSVWSCEMQFTAVWLGFWS